MPTVKGSSGESMIARSGPICSAGSALKHHSSSPLLEIAAIFKTLAGIILKKHSTFQLSVYFSHHSK